MCDDSSWHTFVAEASGARDYRSQRIGFEGRCWEPHRSLDDQIGAIRRTSRQALSSPASWLAVGSRIGKFREAWPSSLRGGGCGGRSMSVPSLSDGHAVIYVATTHVLREQYVPNFVAVRQHHDP